MCDFCCCSLGLKQLYQLEHIWMNLACNCVHLWMPAFNMVVCTWSIGVIVVPRTKRKVSIEPGVLKVLTEIINIRQQWCICFDGNPWHFTNLTEQKDRARIFETNLLTLGSVLYAYCNPRCWTLRHTAWEKWKKKQPLLVALGNWTSAAWMSANSKFVVILWTTGRNPRLFTLSPIIEKHLSYTNLEFSGNKQ